MVITNATQAPLPAWATRLVTDDARRRIEAKIAAAELTTSGEIVPILVRSSAAVGHVWLVLALIFLFVFSTVEPMLAGILAPPNDLLVLLPLPVVLIALAFALSRQHVVQRWLTSPATSRRKSCGEPSSSSFAPGCKKPKAPPAS